MRCREDHAGDTVVCGLRPTVLVLASTYPRWANDPEPAFVHELCRRLVARFEVVAVVPDAPGADASGLLDGVEVVRYRYAPRRLQTLVNHGGIAVNLRRSPWKYLLLPGFVLGQYLAARRILKQRRIDVIHAHWLLPQGEVARRLAALSRIPYLVTSHGGDLFGLRAAVLTRFKRAVAASSAAMTVVSKAMGDEAERIGLKPPRLCVLPMGVELQRRFVPDPVTLRDPDELLFVGRLVPKKGVGYLLDAIPLIVARRPGLKLTIVGFGPEEDALRAKVRRYGIAAHVTFAGAMAQEALPALYRRAGLFVAPFVRDASGDQEGLPVALMEAIGCGCPVIVGDVPGVEDLLGDAAGRICVDPTCPVELASRILDVLGDVRRACVEVMAMRERVLQHIDWERTAAGYADLLGSCLKTPEEKVRRTG